MQRFALVMAAVLLGACSAQEATVPLDSEPLNGGALTSGDRAALHALDTAYVKAWLDPDGATRSEALLSLFAPDVVVYPGRGRAPLNGIEELRAYWFAEDFSPTAIEYIGGDHRPQQDRVRVERQAYCARGSLHNPRAPRRCRLLADRPHDVERTGARVIRCRASANRYSAFDSGSGKPYMPRRPHASSESDSCAGIGHRMEAAFP